MLNGILSPTGYFSVIDTSFIINSEYDEDSTVIVAVSGDIQ